ncbi:CHAP domain-containing protein [Streptomyces sp. DSM 40750]|uniref:CHAP domain-containing protein n=1 Tax=Streptomyces sp. DSM 40750 TaxID=2801030 RepID=UPI00214B5D7E|nr:CHAP domain-containing protein [Streptomyces sp. DSM 40750]UUU19351.1 CHAP domain-containing protein [Streptomyces sp. DSM 40750]UUU27305.1 CHAP domain-containing protein [Streptomyces sp. DSM 40750]
MPSITKPSTAKVPARRAATLLLISALAGGALTAEAASAAPVSPQSASVSAAVSLQTAIKSKAQQQVGLSPRNREMAGNCNYYSAVATAPKSGSVGKCKKVGGLQWRYNNWCADFVRYVWKNAGARTKGTDAFAGSFYRARNSIGTWHARGSYTPKIGDAVLYDWDGGSPSLGTNGWDVDHIGIVIGYNPKTKALTTIEGNTTKSGNGGTEGVYKRTRHNTKAGDVVGYVTPRK